MSELPPMVASAHDAALAQLPVLSASDIGDEALAWPILRHDELAEGAVFSFVRDQVGVPGGGEMTREYVAHTGAVAIIAWDGGTPGRVAVVRQYRHPIGMRLVEAPAGLLDAPGEDPLVAAQRELAEEAQLAAATWHVLADIVPSPGTVAESLRLYLARDLRRTQRPEGFEIEHEEAHMDVSWAPLHDLVAAILAGRVQNGTLCIGALALNAVLASGSLVHLRSADAPWPARDLKLRRDEDLRHHGT